MDAEIRNINIPYYEYEKYIRATERLEVIRRIADECDEDAISVRLLRDIIGEM